MLQVTVEGLEDQLLATLVKEEEPAIEDRRVRLVSDSAESKRQLKELEDKILELLSSAKVHFGCGLYFCNPLGNGSIVPRLGGSRDLGTNIVYPFEEKMHSVCTGP
jgi:hypothetical protein